MAKKNYLFQIQSFDNGIAPSAFKGFEKMTGVDLVSAPGIARCGFLGTKTSGTTITDRPTWGDIDPTTGNIYVVDKSHNVYKSTDSGATWSAVTHAGASTGVGNGLRIWKNYLFLSGNAKIDVMKISDGTWTNDFGTAPGFIAVSDTGLHPMLWGQDDILYHGSTKYIASLAEVANKTFLPSDATTYTLTAKALTLPANVTIRCLEELGKNLMIGVWNGGIGAPIALVYPWDRTSASFNLPIRFSGDGIHAMKTIGQLMYVLHGLTGKLSYTNGSLVTPLGGLNYPANETYTPQPGAIANHNSRLFFGFGSGSTYPNGVYSLTPTGAVGNAQPIFTCENISTQGSASTQTIGVVLSATSTTNPYQYMIGWQDTNVSGQGMDVVGTSGYRLSSLGSVTIDSPFYNIGLPRERVKITKVSVQLEQPLATGQTMAFSYRTDKNAAYTAFGDTSYTPAITNSQSSFEIAFPGLETDSIQFRIQMTSATSSSATPGLIQITVQ